MAGALLGSRVGREVRFRVGGVRWDVSISLKFFPPDNEEFNSSSSLRPFIYLFLRRAAQMELFKRLQAAFSNQWAKQSEVIKVG